MSGKGAMVGLYIQLEIIHEAIALQKRMTAGRVKIILVFGRFLWLWLDIKLTREFNLLFVFHRHVQESAQMVQLAAHIGVEQGLIPFASAPENIAFAI